MHDFKHLMHSMKLHYTLQPSHSYALPISSLVVREDHLSEAAKKDIHAALEFAETQLLGLVEHEHQKLNVIIKAHNDGLAINHSLTVGDASPSTASFVEQMEALKAEAQAKSGQTIDAIYDKLITAGEQHPPAQPVILHKTQQVSDTSTNALGQLNSVYSSVLNEGIIGPIKSIGHAVSSVGNTIVHGFKSIF